MGKKKERRDGICADRKALYLAVKVMTQVKRGNGRRTKQMYSTLTYTFSFHDLFFQFDICASTRKDSWK